MKQKKMKPAASTAHLIILLMALPLLLATSCRDRDDEPSAGPGKLITVSRLNVSIDGMLSMADMNAARSAETRAASTDGKTRADAPADDADEHGYAGVVKKTFVKGDVLHFMVALTAKDFDNDKYQVYTATLEDDGWSFDRLLELPQDPTKTADIQVFYDGTKRVYTSFDLNIVDNTAENGNAFAALIDAWNGTKDDANGLTTYPDLLLKNSGVEPAPDGTLTIHLIHQSSLVSISSIKNQLGAKVTAIHANTSDSQTPPATATISLYAAPADASSAAVPPADASAAAASGKVEAIIGMINNSTSQLKSFTVTLADGRKFDVPVPKGGGSIGRELAEATSYTYRLILLPGSITAQEVDEATPSYKVSRDPAVPAGYIPIYTKDDLRKIGQKDAKGNYPPAVVNGYLYTNASSAILAADAANNTLIYDEENSAYTDSGINASASLAANGTSGSDATSDGSANVGPLTFSLSARYILMNDIDLTPGNVSVDKNLSNIGSVKSDDLWTPIGDSSNPFTGRFHGNGFTIRGMTINSDAYYLGLFGYTKGAVIYNVHMKDARVKGTRLSDGNFGSLVGRCDQSTISSCSATGCALQSTGKYSYIGGLVGYNSSGTLTRCHATACALSGGIGLKAGGLVGYNQGILASCYTAGCTAGCTGSGNYFGGLVGWNSATIYGCYATYAQKSGDGAGDFGSLVGFNNGGATIASSYAINAASGTLGLVGISFGGPTTACVSPFEKSSSDGSGGGDAPTGGGSYWEIISNNSSSPISYTGGYAPLTDDVLLEALNGNPSFTIQGNLKDVYTLLVNNTGNDITGDTDMGGGENGGTPVGALGKIPPGGLYTRKIEWRARSIWGGNTAPQDPTVTLPRIDWTFNGEED